jgi:cell division septation protein DedD
MYNFLFDKKTLMLLLAGLGLSGALLFFAGLLVGVQVGLPPASGAVVVQPPRERPEAPPAKNAPAFAPAECPCEPGVQMAALPFEPCPELEPGEAPPERSAPAPVPAKEPEPAVVASTPVPAPVPEAEPAVLLASAPVPEPEPGMELEPEAEPVAEASPEVPAAEVKLAVLRPAAFAIQVGAFLSAENLEKALEELRGRGYEPYVVELQGSQSTFQTVLIGRYSNRGEALRAASDFRRREGMPAVVLRVDS